ncbi:MAG: hypothetical protein IPJ20_07620 [Flammeovirgaceae bacterium]|nr:hypothetical protein [Flammeovirgaceae bacterium]
MLASTFESFYSPRDEARQRGRAEKSDGCISLSTDQSILGETIVLVSISLVLGIILLELLVPMFNALVGQHLEVVYFGKNSVILYILTAGLITGIVAGS